MPLNVFEKFMVGGRFGRPFIRKVSHVILEVNIIVTGQEHRKILRFLLQYYNFVVIL